MTSSTRSLAGAAAHGSFVTVGAQSVRIITQLASIMVLARLLTPTDYGYVAMVLAIIGVAELIRDFGLSAAAVQSRDLTVGQQNNLFWLNSAIGSAATLVVALSSPLIAVIYGVPELTVITICLSPVFLLNGIATQFRAHINRSMRFVRLSATDVVPQVVAFVVAIALAVTTQSYWALIAQQLTVAAIGLLAAIVLSGWLPGRPSREASVRYHVRFGSSLFLTNLLTYATNNSQTLMMGVAWGPSQAGVFSRAYQLMSLPLTQMVAPMTKVALPVLSRLRDEPDRYSETVRRAQLLGLYLTAPVFLLCFALAAPLIEVALGDQWAAAVPIFALLALGGAFRAMSQLSHWLFLSSGNTAKQLRFNSWALPIVLLAMLAGLPWGGMGIAVGHLVGYALYWPLSMWVSARAAGIGIGRLAGNAARVFPVIAIGIIGAGWVATHAPVPAILQVVIGSALAIVWVLSSAWALPSGRRDLRTLWAFVSRARRG